MFSVMYATQVLTYIQRDCNWSDGLSYSHCSLLVAVTESESRIIVSFEGTQNIVHLQDQLFAAFVNGLNETTFGGKVRHIIPDLLTTCRPL